MSEEGLWINCTWKWASKHLRRAENTPKGNYSAPKEEKSLCVSLLGSAQDREQVACVRVSRSFPTLTLTNCRTSFWKENWAKIRKPGQRSCWKRRILRDAHAFKQAPSQLPNREKGKVTGICKQVAANKQILNMPQWTASVLWEMSPCTGRERDIGFYGMNPELCCIFSVFILEMFCTSSFRSCKGQKCQRV